MVNLESYSRGSHCGCRHAFRISQASVCTCLHHNSCSVTDPDHHSAGPAPDRQHRLMDPNSTEPERKKGHLKQSLPEFNPAYVIVISENYSKKKKIDLRTEVET
jgi:hypothetical protein